MHVEGMIIQKTPYKERDLICHVLLRSGKTLPVYFYGGRGGGKKAKGSFLEIGFMLSLELREQRKALQTSIYIAKEYNLIWSSSEIRSDYQSLCLLSFYLEMVSKIALSEDLASQHGDEFESLFKVTSNAVFFLDDALSKNQFSLFDHLFIFLAKLIFELGVLPNTEHCLFCEKNFGVQDLCLFAPVEGGFSCLNCNTNRGEFLSDNMALRSEYESDRKLRRGLIGVMKMPYKDYKEVEKMNFHIVSSQLNYINYQFGFDLKNFKTWKMIHG